VAFVSLFLGVTLFALAGLHAHWALGGRFARTYAVPTRGGVPNARPSAGAFAAVAAGLAAAGVLALIAGGLAGVEPAKLHGSMTSWLWLVASAFALRAVGDFRLIGLRCRDADARFRHGERTVVAPLCLLIAAAAARLAVGIA
jgi:hypothetical protein